MKYDKPNHLKLLKYSKKLETEGTSMYNESPKDFLTLCEYTAMIINHLHWENRTQYFEMIEQLVNGPIKFLALRKKHESVNKIGKLLASELILLEPNDKSEGFDDLIDEIVMLFDRYCPDPYIREDYEFSEEELKNLIQQIFIEMKDRYP